MKDIATQTNNCPLKINTELIAWNSNLQLKPVCGEYTAVGSGKFVATSAMVTAAARTEQLCR